MSQRVALAIEISDERAPVFTAMAGRSRAVGVVDDVAAAQALITDRLEVAHRAAADDQYVLVLDPFSISPIDRQSLESTGRAAPALLSRFQPPVRQVKRALDSGKLGEPGLLRIHCWQPSSAAADALLARELDLVIWMFGDRPSLVYGCQRPGYVQAHLGFSAGGMALLDIETRLPDRNAYYSLSLIGSTGAAYADDHHNVNLLLDQSGPRVHATTQSNVAVGTMIDAFAGAIITGDPFDAAWRRIDHALQVSDQVRQAAASADVVAGVGHG